MPVQMLSLKDYRIEILSFYMLKQNLKTCFFKFQVMELR